MEFNIFAITGVLRSQIFGVGVELESKIQTPIPMVRPFTATWKKHTLTN